MARMNVDPLATFADGSHLLVSTQISKDGTVACELYVAQPDEAERLSLRAVSNQCVAETCLAAQESAYHSATRLYPNEALTIKKPPYLIWHGPSTSQ